MGPLRLFCASVDHSDHYGTIFCVDDLGMEDEGPRPAQHRPQQDLIPITTLFEGDVVGLDEEPTSMGVSMTKLSGWVLALWKASSMLSPSLETGFLAYFFSSSITFKFFFSYSSNFLLRISSSSRCFKHFLATLPNSIFC